MAPHIVARATEPFFTTKSRGEGTGLGLAMAHGFVQQSGGRLEIESAVGQGTTIRMLFPVFRQKADVAEHVEAQTGYQARPLDHLTAPPLVLVVDDSREAAAMAGEALQDIGYRVVIAHSAEEALERFEEAQAGGDGFKLVFSDVIMPGGANGLVLAPSRSAGSTRVCRFYSPPATTTRWPSMARSPMPWTCSVSRTGAAN